MERNGERVIFRTERDPYRDAQNFLAVFPDDSARPGYLESVAFYFSGNDVIFESFSEMSYGYYYNNTRIVHKGTAEAARCMEAIRRRFSSPPYNGGEFRQVEKIRKK